MEVLTMEVETLTQLKSHKCGYPALILIRTTYLGLCSDEKMQNFAFF